MTRPYEHVVVGKGLIGAAALRHLSAGPGRVAAVGPDEPADLGNHRGVFSSHYDEGRIVTRLSRDLIWARLVDREIEAYPELGEAGGGRAYRPLGMLYLAPERDKGLRRGERIARRIGADHVGLGPAALERRFPQLRMPSGFEGLFEEAPAGIINPRALIRSQLAAARSNGADVVSETVVGAEKLPRRWRLVTDSGREVESRNLLLSVGAYANCFGLLPRKLALRVKSETTILLEIPEAEAARLGDMPPLSYRIRSAAISGVYVVPPLRYPDGRFYLKLGADTDGDSILAGYEEIQAWMTTGSDEVRPDMRAAIFDLVPDLDLLSARVKRCLVTYSAHGRPYVDRLDEGLFVATAGNGAAAACSDTLGSLAADLMLDRPWRPDFRRRTFVHRLAE